MNVMGAQTAPGAPSNSEEQTAASAPSSTSTGAPAKTTPASKSTVVKKTATKTEPDASTKPAALSENADKNDKPEKIEKPAKPVKPTKPEKPPKPEKVVKAKEPKEPKPAKEPKEPKEPKLKTKKKSTDTVDTTVVTPASEVAPATTPPNVTPVPESVKTLNADESATKPKKTHKVHERKVKETAKTPSGDNVAGVTSASTAEDKNLVPAPANGIVPGASTSSDATTGTNTNSAPFSGAPVPASTDAVPEQKPASSANKHKSSSHSSSHKKKSDKVDTNMFVQPASSDPESQDLKERPTTSGTDGTSSGSDSPVPDPGAMTSPGN